MRRTHVRVVDTASRRKRRRQWRVVRFWDGVAEVHWVVYPLLVLAFFWWLAYGHR
jgi:hypothetical protein